MTFQRVIYRRLNSRQKENFNFQKIAARLADYGFNCLRLSDDWEGADFIACHVDGETILEVQLKSRLSVARKYVGKDLHIAFLHGNDCYVYPHDVFLSLLVESGAMREQSALWQSKGIRSWPNPPNWAIDALAAYRI